VDLIASADIRVFGSFFSVSVEIKQCNNNLMLLSVVFF